MNKSSTHYVSVDPFTQAFQKIELLQNQLKAYPILNEPCNFLSAHAEQLPFKSESFDYIHMRSVLDHFADPYFALLEANRCAKKGAKLLIGLSITDKITYTKTSWLTKLKNLGLFGLIKFIFRKCLLALKLAKAAEEKDDHMFRFTHENLKSLIESTGWTIRREHWQKPPFAHCLYILSEKVDAST